MGEESSRVIILIVIVAAIFLFLHWMVSPYRVLAHAARAKFLPRSLPIAERIATPTFYIEEDENGEERRFSRKNRFYGVAYGPSMSSRGINDGDEFFGDRIDPNSTLDEYEDILTPGKIVVVDEETQFSETGIRLRIIKEFHKDECLLEFEKCYQNLDHSSRSLDKVVAVVTHVSPS